MIKNFLKKPYSMVQKSRTQRNKISLLNKIYTYIIVDIKSTIQQVILKVARIVPGVLQKRNKYSLNEWKSTRRSQVHNSTI